MERLGVISQRVLARLVAANDNLEWSAGADAARPSPARAPTGRHPASSAVGNLDRRCSGNAVEATAARGDRGDVRAGSVEERPGHDEPVVSRGRAQLGWEEETARADEDG